MLDQNYVEFDIRIGHVLVSFPFLWIVKEKCKVNHVPIPNINTYKYILTQTLFFTKSNANYHGYL